MQATQLVSLITGILGAVIGSAALTLSILNYLRDKPQIKVTIQWDMTDTQRGLKMGVVRVTNIGRRPIHLAIVALALPPNHEHTHLMLSDSIRGKRLEEGAEPAVYLVNYGGLLEYKDGWRKMRAVAEDSSGKKYFSAYPRKKPSWANESR